MVSQLQDLGYESHVALQNLGSIGTIFTLYLVKVGIIGVLTPFTKNETIKKMQQNLSQQAFFGDFFAIVIDSYYEILISGYLQLGLKDEDGQMKRRFLYQIPYEKVNGDTVSEVLIIIFLILALVFVPLSLYYVYI